MPYCAPALISVMLRASKPRRWLAAASARTPRRPLSAAARIQAALAFPSATVGVSLAGCRLTRFLNDDMAKMALAIDCRERTARRRPREHALMPKHPTRGKPNA